jgi:hypothetical protein
MTAEFMGGVSRKALAYPRFERALRLSMRGASEGMPPNSLASLGTLTKLARRHTIFVGEDPSQIVVRSVAASVSDRLH